MISHKFRSWSCWVPDRVSNKAHTAPCRPSPSWSPLQGKGKRRTLMTCSAGGKRHPKSARSPGSPKPQTRTNSRQSHMAPPDNRRSWSKGWATWRRIPLISQSAKINSKWEEVFCLIRVFWQDIRKAIIYSMNVCLLAAIVNVNVLPLQDYDLAFVFLSDF